MPLNRKASPIVCGSLEFVADIASRTRRRIQFTNREPGSLLKPCHKVRCSAGCKDIRIGYFKTSELRNLYSSTHVPGSKTHRSEANRK
jgi:hypothetical protein